MGTPTRVVFVIPAFNEAQTIERVVSCLKKSGTVVVIDDASTDGTPKLATQAGAQCISQDKNSGYDSAILAGVQNAFRYEPQFIVTVDADNQFSAKDIASVLSQLEDYDLVVGQRNSTPRFSESAFRLVSKSVLGVNDPFCGLKGFRVHLAKYAASNWIKGTVNLTPVIAAMELRATISNVDIHIRPRLDKSRFSGNWLGEVKIIFAFCKAVLVWAARNASLKRNRPRTNNP